MKIPVHYAAMHCRSLLTLSIPRLVTGPGEVPVLVCGSIKETAVVAKAVLRAVAMMHVKINNSHSPYAIPCLRIARGDARIIDEAEAARAVAFSMMTRRAHAAKRSPDEKEIYTRMSGH